jgi:hypothetical protein
LHTVTTPKNATLKLPRAVDNKLFHKPKTLKNSKNLPSAVDSAMILAQMAESGLAKKADALEQFDLEVRICGQPVFNPQLINLILRFLKQNQNSLVVEPIKKK